MAQLVARCVWDAEVACSSQVAPTKDFLRKFLEGQIMNEKKPTLSEPELRRLLALDRVAVEERLAKNKADGKKMGGIIALVIILAAIVVFFIMTAIGSKR